MWSTISATASAWRVALNVRGPPLVAERSSSRAAGTTTKRGLSGLLLSATNGVVSDVQRRVARMNVVQRFRAALKTR